MFNSDIQVGNKGENIIYNYLINHPSTDSLIDVSNVIMQGKLGSAEGKASGGGAHEADLSRERLHGDHP